MHASERGITCPYSRLVGGRSLKPACTQLFLTSCPWVWLLIPRQHGKDHKCSEKIPALLYKHKAGVFVLHCWNCWNRSLQVVGCRTGRCCFLFLFSLSLHRIKLSAFPVQPQDGQTQLEVQLGCLSFPHTAVQEMAFCPWPPVLPALGPGNPVAFEITNWLPPSVFCVNVFSSWLVWGCGMRRELSFGTTEPSLGVVIVRVS